MKRLTDRGLRPREPAHYRAGCHRPRCHKKDAMRPTGARESHKPHPKTKRCVSTRSPLSARHGRLTSRRRTWHASRTKRSVSNIIGSPPNGIRRWDAGRHSGRFIPLDHPGRMPISFQKPPGDQALLQAGSSGPRAPSSGPRAGLEDLKDSSSPPPGASRSP